VEALGDDRQWEDTRVCKTLIMGSNPIVASRQQEATPGNARS
jgi:hypothetical protein